MREDACAGLAKGDDDGLVDAVSKEVNSLYALTGTLTKPIGNCKHTHTSRTSWRHFRDDYDGYCLNRYNKCWFMHWLYAV